MYNEKLYNEWHNLYEIAKKNMHASKINEGVLIEVAAQHPLIDGTQPNEEFSKRLDLAITLYEKMNKDGKKVNIYVPGSIHKCNDEVDKISLSNAGRNYLIKKGIPEVHIFSEDMNNKYKGEAGVYNSADECYVACKIFSDCGFGELHCVCSSGQMMRKMLCYIKNGCVPYMHTVSCDEMFHDYVDEAFICIPRVLEDIQGDSVEEEIRNQRRPNKLG